MRKNSLIRSAAWLLAAGCAAWIVGTSRAGGQGATEPSAPRLYRVVVPVSDIDHAAKFYGELLGVEGKRVTPGRHYIDCRGVILALFDPKGDGDAQPARPLPDHLYFAVSDLEAAFARARELGGLSTELGDGQLPMGEIAKRPWGERSFYTSDPTGTRLCFVDEETVFTGR